MVHLDVKDGRSKDYSSGLQKITEIIILDWWLANLWIISFFYLSISSLIFFEFCFKPEITVNHKSHYV